MTPDSFQAPWLAALYLRCALTHSCNMHTCVRQTEVNLILDAVAYMLPT